MLNQKKQEAYLNEFKGNLFEFLVAHQLAKKFNLELPFLKSIPPEFNKKLKSYEQIVRQYRAELITELSAYAKQVSSIEYWEKLKKIESIFLCGKLAGQNQHDQFSEADLVLNLTEDNIKYISLKLTHDSAFVNTKSAGLKSFFKMYFSRFSTANEIQERLNSLVEIEYQNFSRRLHELRSIEYHPNFKHWIEAGYPQLPGELLENESLILHDYYLKLISSIHAEIVGLNNTDTNLFKQSLMALIGKTDKNLVQVICFYSKNDPRKLSRIKIDEKIIDEFHVLIDQKIKNSTNFSIEMADRVLQIRIKPMNTFTQMSFKVNCSVKFFD